MPNITEILFDCDNTLVLSEDLAFEACAELANLILEKQGISHRYTGPQLLVDFVGQNFRGMMVSLQQKFGFSLPEDEFNRYVTEEEDRVIATLKAKTQPCGGCNEQLEKLAASKKYHFAIVSSSAYRRVLASIQKVEQDKYFELEHIYSAATSLPKPTSKPDPAIYNWALEKLGRKPEECVAIEDSRSGATSAVRAGIHLIGYVGAYHGAEKQAEMKKMLEDVGAEAIMKDWKEFSDCLATIEAL